jgi:hypothetical protein
MKLSTLLSSFTPVVKSFFGISSEVVITLAHPQSAHKDLLLVPRGCLEWDIMWQKVGRLRVNRGLEKPTIANNFGDIWEYMETVKSSTGFNHVFRHRHHPKTGYKIYIEVKATIGFKIIGNDAFGQVAMVAQPQ